MPENKGTLDSSFGTLGFGPVRPRGPARSFCLALAQGCGGGSTPPGKGISAQASPLPPRFRVLEDGAPWHRPGEAGAGLPLRTGQFRLGMREPMGGEDPCEREEPWLVWP